MNFIHKSRSHPLILLYRNRPPIQGKQGHYDIILSPQLYVMKREKIPVRFAYEVRKIAPGELEDLGAAPHWRFEAFRQAGEWVLIAYDPEDILRTLQEAGLSPGQVSRLYFAQQFAPMLKGPVHLGEVGVLARVDDTVTMLPSRLVAQTQEGMNFSQLERPAQSFSLHVPSSRLFAWERELRWVALGLALIGAAWWAEGVRYAKVGGAYEARLEHLRQDHPSLASGIVRRNILQRYRQIDHRQREIRQNLRKIASLLSRESKLRSLSLDAKGYEARIEAPARSRARIVKLAQGSGLAARIEGSGVTIRGAWK